MARGLTDRQREVLNLIVRYVRERGYPPTLRELQADLDIGTPRGVLSHIKALELKGYLRRDPTPRGIKVLREADEKLDKEVVLLPIVGRVPAGMPLLAEETIEEWIPWPRSLLAGQADVFLLRVVGDSMNGDDIRSGDLVLVVPQPEAESSVNDIVVAIHHGEVTIKRLARQEGRLVLRPSNPVYDTIEVDEETEIQGEVIGRMRRPD